MQCVLYVWYNYGTDFNLLCSREYFKNTLTNFAILFHSLSVGSFRQTRERIFNLDVELETKTTTESFGFFLSFLCSRLSWFYSLALRLIQLKVVSWHNTVAETAYSMRIDGIVVVYFWYRPHAVESTSIALGYTHETVNNV